MPHKHAHDFDFNMLSSCTWHLLPRPEALSILQSNNICKASSMGEMTHVSGGYVRGVYGGWLGSANACSFTNKTLPADDRPQIDGRLIFFEHVRSRYVFFIGSKSDCECSHWSLFMRVYFWWPRSTYCKSYRVWRPHVSKYVLHTHFPTTTQSRNDVIFVNADHKNILVFMGMPTPTLIESEFPTSKWTVG